MSPPPGRCRVGVVGGGQLARMMGEAAHDVGVELLVLATSLDDAAVATCDDVVLGDPKDFGALEAIARSCDVVTFDHELVDLELVATLETRGVVIRPNARALHFAVDKAYQRAAFAEAGVPVPRFLVVDSARDPRIGAFLDDLAALPVVKAARGGYDGRGVAFPDDREQVLTTIDEFARSGDVVLEERLTLHGEVAQLIARAVDGSVAIYPLVGTIQANGMCIEVDYPAQVTVELAVRAGDLAKQIASLVDAVGVLAVEFFVTASGLLVNEVALRPHNSGHWTIEGTATSQFANHLLAVSGQSLGDVTPRCDAAAMVNVVGSHRPTSLDDARSVEGAYVHDYGKAWRPGRKLGHVTVLGNSATLVHVRAWESARAYGTRTREA